jgi:hypothetical protein
MPPRLDQISELTRGIELPLAPLHPEHLRVIIDVLSEAWQDLVRRHLRVLLEEDEAVINALMETRLLAFLDEKPLWAQMVRAVARGRETISFDGSHLEKRPDLSLYLTRRASFPLVVECKIIDAKTDKNGRLYCENGISRFLKGEYAWAGREALMIAYVRDKSTIASVLASLLTKPAYAVETELVAVGVAPPDIATSSHGRSFRYPFREPPRDQPGPIALWHLWLPAAK